MRYEDALTLGLLLAAGCFCIWMVFRKVELKQREQLQRNETLRILVQKFNSSEEFVGFVNSDAGRQLLTPAPQLPKPQLFSALRFVQIGVVLAMIGAGMLSRAHEMRNLTDINFVNQRNDISYFGMLAMMTGVGLLIVAALTRWLGNRWGLFKSETK